MLISLNQFWGVSGWMVNHFWFMMLSHRHLSAFDVILSPTVQDRVAIFTGMLRELSGLGFLEAIAPQWVTKKM